MVLNSTCKNKIWGTKYISGVTCFSIKIKLVLVSYLTFKVVDRNKIIYLAFFSSSLNILFMPKVVNSSSQKNPKKVCFNVLKAPGFTERDTCYLMKTLLVLKRKFCPLQ